MLHHYITAHEQNKIESGIIVSLISFLLPEDVHSEFILFMYFGMVKLPIKH